MNRSLGWTGTLWMLTVVVLLGPGVFKQVTAQIQEGADSTPETLQMEIAFETQQERGSGPERASPKPKAPSLLVDDQSRVVFDLELVPDSKGTAIILPDKADGPLLAQNARTKPQDPLLAVAAEGTAPVLPAGGVSDAERIARLQRGIENDRKVLQQVQAELNDPEAEYHKSELEFKQLDEALEEANKSLQKLRAQGAENLVPKETEFKALQDKWNLAKERFEIAIQERKTTQQKAVTLEEKLQQESEALRKLTGTVPEKEAGKVSMPGPAGGQLPGEAPAVNPTVVPGESVGGTSGPPGAAKGADAEPSKAVGAGMAAGLVPAVPAEGQSSQGSTDATATASTELEKPASKELRQATETAQKKEAAAQNAEQEAKSVGQRMELLRKDIELERSLLQSARKKADIAEQTQNGLEEEYRGQLRDGAGSSALQDLQKKIAETRERFRAARTEGRERASRLDDLQSRYVALQSEQIVAMREAEQTRKAADSAQQKVAQLRNPFTARNFLQWLIDHGPRILMILITMAVALWMSRLAEKRIVDAMVKRGGLGQRAERENRARTLVSVFQNAANVAIVSGGLLMILDIVGAPITALMGGAAVFGLAIAFGAQSLIKDYFYGFMILLEQQYTINDVIRIGDIAGQVERITLRMTVLRDLEGRVHFIPHGQIVATTNMTHGWSRAVFDIGVAYKEDVDRVIEIIKQQGREIREDPQFASLILEDLTMLGLDAFGDSAIVIKFFIKTRPLKQWEIKRELLRRIKRAFDEQGIEIPFPHRTVYHRQEGLNVQIGDHLDWGHRKSA